MRYPVAAMFFVIACFIFGVAWAVITFMLDAVSDAMLPFAAGTSAASTINLLSWAFGILCVFFFICAILLIFALESFADEPEYYYR